MEFYSLDLKYIHVLCFHSPFHVLEFCWFCIYYYFFSFNIHCLEYSYTLPVCIPFWNNALKFAGKKCHERLFIWQYFNSTRDYLDDSKDTQNPLYTSAVIMSPVVFTSLYAFTSVYCTVFLSYIVLPFLSFQRLIWHILKHFKSSVPLLTCHL